MYSILKSTLWECQFLKRVANFPANMYLFKFINRNNKKIEIYSN